MRILITAGPTREPIDPVRYISNRSSGQVGTSIGWAAQGRGHEVTMIVGRGVPTPVPARRIDVETTAEMHAAVTAEFPQHDLLIMAAAVADYRPVKVSTEKLARADRLIIECEATPDIVAAAAATRRPNQRVVGFSLEVEGSLERAREKLLRKGLDLIVYNPLATMESTTIEAALLWPDGRAQTLPCRSKDQFADNLLEYAEALFGRP